MLLVLRYALAALRALARERSELALENIALRHQLEVLSRSRPRLRPADRLMWSWLSRAWPRWLCHLVIVQPATVVRWHRIAWSKYWRWKSRGAKPGRPRTGSEMTSPRSGGGDGARGPTGTSSANPDGVLKHHGPREPAHLVVMAAGVRACLPSRPSPSPYVKHGVLTKSPVNPHRDLAPRGSPADGHLEAPGPVLDNRRSARAVHHEQQAAGWV